jgi:hypothetical protein
MKRIAFIAIVLLLASCLPLGCATVTYYEVQKDGTAVEKEKKHVFLGDDEAEDLLQLIKASLKSQ